MPTLRKLAAVGTVFLLASLVCVIPRAAADEAKAIRIRAGSTEKYTDHEGNVWLGEEGFEGGDTISRDPDMKIENTKDPALYLCEHYSMDSFSRDIPNG